MSDGAAFPSPARPPDRGPAWGRMPRSVALALAALLLAGGGYAAGALLGGDMIVAPASPAPRSVAPPVASAEEPVAEVARLLLPSAVHIRAGSGVGSGVIYDGGGLGARRVLRSRSCAVGKAVPAANHRSDRLVFTVLSELSAQAHDRHAHP